MSIDQELDFYQHEMDWANRLILGDSLLVMNSLLRREAMAGERPHSVVLTSVVMSVRSFMASEDVPVIVGQRLKRLPTIIDKLSREPEMQLSRMHDVGGCRAVLPPGRLDVVAGIRKRLDRSPNRVVRVYDYNEHPKPSGYRAVHVVVERLDRLIEVQIRTEGQQRWGDSVERLQSKLGVALKDGQGPEDLLRYYTLAGYAVACQEAGRLMDEPENTELAELVPTIRHYFSTEEGAR